MPGVEVVKSEAFGHQFSSTTLKQVIMPRVKIIENIAFNGCAGLQNVDIPECTTLGYQAFAYCQALTHLELPKVTSLGAYAFSNCKNLAYVNLPACKGLLETHSAFTGCIGMVTLKIPLVEKIHEMWNEPMPLLTTFEANSLKTVETGNFLYGCTSLVELTLPNLETVPETPFLCNSTSLKKVSMPKLKNYGGSGFNDSSVEEIELPSLTRMGGGSLKGCPNLRRVVFPKVEQLEAGAFAGNQKLEYLDLSSVQTLSPGSVFNCPALKTLKVGSATTIEANSLKGTTAIENLTCTNMTAFDAIVKDANTADNDYTNVVTSLTLTNQPSVDDGSFVHATHLQHLTLENATTAIDVKTFNADVCPDMETITITDGNTAFSDKGGVLYDKVGTTLLYYPPRNENADRPWSLASEQLAGIGRYALYKYPQAHQLLLGSGFHTIGEHSLDGSAINRVVFDDASTLSSVSDYAFANMTQEAFRYIELPKTVRTLGEGAFSGSKNLLAVKFYTNIDDDASELQTIGEKAFNGLPSITSIDIPSTVTSIGKEAFSGDSKLAYTVLPASVATIGDNAFAGTSLADGVFMLGTVAPTIGTGAFPSTANLYVKPSALSAFSGMQPLFATVTSDIPLTISTGKYVTFSRGFDVDLSSASGLKAYRTASYNTTGNTGDGAVIAKVHLKEIADGKISAGQGVLLRSDDQSSFTYHISDDAVPQQDDPYLRASTAATHLTKTDKDNTYTLYTLQTKNGEQAYYYSSKTYDDWDKAATLAGWKSYLAVKNMANGAPAKIMLMLYEDETDGIFHLNSDVNKQDADATWYTLNGQIISRPISKGIYIHRGKKVIVK
jgi:hypothetical protein